MTENYYTILELHSDATEDDIKRSYRKLALQFHPDRNPPGDRFAETRFREITQAYHVLSDKNRRIIYDYDLKHGIKRVAGRPTSDRPAEKGACPKAEPISNLTILKQVRRIRKELDAVKFKSRIRQPEVYKALNTVLNAKSIEIVLSSGDKTVSHQIIREGLAAVKYLSSRYIDKLSVKLVKLAGPDNEMIVEIHRFTKRQKRKQKIQYYIPFAIIFVIIGILATLFSML